MDAQGRVGSPPKRIFGVVLPSVGAGSGFIGLWDGGPPQCRVLGLGFRV